MDDPRLTKDLISRGVDDIVYKPTNYAAFAAKVKGLVIHRLGRCLDNQAQQRVSVTPHLAPVPEAERSEEEEVPRSEEMQSSPDGFLVPISDIENKISLVSRILPVSKTYPSHYRHLIKQCAELDEALIEQEKQVFPENHARIMTRLLSVWDIPDEICKPLNYVLDSYASLSRLSDPTRTRVELVKLAVFIGQLATTAWHSWDLVELPPASLLKRLRIHDVRQILEQTRGDTQLIMDFNSKASSGKSQPALPQHSTATGRTIHYENVSTLPFDFIAQLIREMDIEVAGAIPDDSAPLSKLLVNCIGVSKTNPPPACALPSTASVFVITDSNNPPEFAVPRKTLKVPASYGKLRAAILGVATTKGTNGNEAACAAGYDIQV
ncbi:MAG: HDOD domain-containing protein [Planctomycetota bacterium]|nr:HDOD domain-containing protein [Planctomycetota bacterium]